MKRASTVLWAAAGGAVLALSLGFAAVSAGNPMEERQATMKAVGQSMKAGAGLNSGFMMAQVTAAALVSENKVLAHPASVDSITTSGNKEDYVSMGMTAALKLRKIVENTRNVIAIEAMAAAQALEFLLPLKTSKRGQAAVAAIRSACPAMEKDRAMYQDFARVAELVASGRVAEAMR